MNDYRFLLSGKWLGFFLLACAAAVVSVYLGGWQMDRNDHLVGENAKITQNYRAEPLTGAAAAEQFAVHDERLTWHPVELTGEYLPEDQVLHRALLAYACDQVMLEPVLRRHGASWASPGLHIASLDHAMWWHRSVRVDEWLLYAQSAPSAQGGRGLGAAQVWTRDGALVATIAQEGMVRLD